MLGGGHGFQDQPRAKHHYYSLAYIKLALDLISLDLSPRQCVEVIKLVRGYLLNPPRLCAHTTIRNWNNKRNLGLLTLPSAGQLAGPHALLTDMSMSLGKRRLLLIVAAPLTKWSFHRPLTMADVHVVGLHLQATFKGQEVAQAIQQVSIDHPAIELSYGISDGGGELVSGLRQAGVVRVPDCHHYFAKELKKEYSHRSDYQSFMTDCLFFKRKNNMNDNACLLPPRLGHHSRFMNVGLIAQWAMDRLNWRPPRRGATTWRRLKQSVKWLEKHRAIIEELYAVTQVGYKMLELLKHRGLSHHTIEQCRSLLRTAQLGESVAQRYERYFTECVKSLSQRLLDADYPVVMCSSDVVESLFGVFKSRTKGRLDSRCLDITHYARQHMSVKQVQTYLEADTIQGSTAKLRAMLSNGVQTNRRQIRQQIRQAATN